MRKSIVSIFHMIIQSFMELYTLQEFLEVV